MNEQTRATSTATAVTARAVGRAASTVAPPEDAWDRLAALAFGGVTSAGGCSEHAHDCTCLAERGADRLSYPDLASGVEPEALD